MLELTLVGHLGKDAVINDFNGRKVINFSVAHTEKYKDANGTVVTKTIWVECAKWGDQTAIAAYLKSGTLVAISGRPEASAFMNKENKPMASLKCNVNFIQLLSSGHQQQPQTPSLPAVPNGTSFQQTPQPSTQPEPVDDLPF